MQYRSLSSLLLCILTLFWHQISCSCQSIVLVSSNSHFGVVHRIESAFHSQPKSYPRLVHIIADLIHEPTFFDTTDACVIVTIGSQALHAVLQTDTNIPVLSILSRKNTFDQLLKSHHRNLNDLQHPLSVIYLDQPIERQLQLIQHLLPVENQQPIGVLLGSHSCGIQEELQQAAKQKNLAITSIHVDKSENPVAILDSLLDETTVVLAIPDNEIYHSKKVRGLLLTAFHKRIPLIGYSRTFVSNGALAAVYSSTKQLADQTIEMIFEIIEHPDRIPPPQYPKKFSVAINHQVARSLGKVIDSEAALNYAKKGSASDQ